MKVIAFGSCMSNLTTAHLVHTYGFEQTHSVHHNRSDNFIRNFIDKSAQMIPMEYFDGLLIHKKEHETTARQFLRNQYQEYVGFHDLLQLKQEGQTLFTDLATKKFDVILMDNLMDVSALLMHPKELPEFTKSPLFLNCGFYENEKEIASKFEYGGFLDPTASATNSLRICRWLRGFQPQAKIFFLCYHFVSSVGAPDRYQRIRDFYIQFAPRARAEGIDVVPPLLVAPELTKGEVDWPHFQMPVYKALAGYVYLHTVGGLPTIGRPYILPPSQLQTQTVKVATTIDAAPVTLQVDVAHSTLNPYAGLPASAFWRRAISQVSPEEVDPVTDVPFQISRGDWVATAGSCFAQHISRTLMREGFKYLVTEGRPMSAGAIDEGFGVFPARFGNVYTPRQLLQLFERAYGRFAPVDSVWIRADGALVDPFRPRIQEQGFGSLEALLADRGAHLMQVREMFEKCDIFIFTLGLTEGWVSRIDGAVFPLASGVAGAGVDPEAYRFENFSVDEMVADFTEFVDQMRAVNPKCKIILTLSPVPLIATYEERHVLVSTVYSKSALRVVAEMVRAARRDVAYFPSYEIITGSYAHSRYFAEDLREVTAEGVARVMAIFKKHYLATEGLSENSTRGGLSNEGVGDGSADSQAPASSGFRSKVDEEAYARELQTIICDEAAIDSL